MALVWLSYTFLFIGLIYYFILIRGLFTNVVEKALGKLVIIDIIHHISS